MAYEFWKSYFYLKISLLTGRIPLVASPYKKRIAREKSLVAVIFSIENDEITTFMKLQSTRGFSKPKRFAFRL